MIFSFDIGRDKIHRTRTVQGDSGDHVFQAFRFQFFDEVLHSGTFKLEHPFRLSCSKGRQHFFIIIIDLIDINGYSAAFFCHTYGILNNRQCTQTQKIHFQQTKLFQCRGHKLSCYRSIRSAGKRHILIHILLTDDNTRRMHGSMSWQSLQTSGEINQLFYLRIGFVQAVKFPVHLQCFIYRNAILIWNHFCYGITQGIGQIHDTSHITDNATGCKRTKGNDLYHPVFSIFSHNIIYDFLPPFKTKINVNIRHGYSLRVQESFKQQTVTYRIQLCDT